MRHYRYLLTLSSIAALSVYAALIASPVQAQTTAAPGLLPAPVEPVAPADRPRNASPVATAKQPLTLEDAVRMALAYNPAIEQANAEFLTATGQTNEARAALRPTLGADAGVNAYSNGINADRREKVVDAGDHTLPTAGAYATLPIDITGYLHAATDQAKFSEIAARLGVNRARNQTVATVQSSFYDVLRARALVTVATENLRDSSARFEDARVKFQNQTVAILDVLRAQTDVASARQQLIGAQSNVAIALSRLNDAIGVDPGSPIDVSEEGAVDQPPGVAPPAVPPVSSGGAPGTGSLDADMAAAESVSAQVAAAVNSPQASTTGPDSGNSHADPELDGLVTEALATRPEVLQGDADIAAARKGIYFARRSTMPQFSVGVRYEYAAQTYGTSVELNNGQAFVGVVIPLYDAGLAHARVQEAMGREADAVASRRSVSDAVSLDVRQSYIQLHDARERVAVANQSLAQAREAFLLARIRYNAGVTAKSGVSPLLEVSDAQAALVLAETNQVNALYDYNAGRVRLNFAIGRYSYTPKGPGFATAPRPLH